jgi:hypothetical protein
VILDLYTLPVKPEPRPLSQITHSRTRANLKGKFRISDKLREVKLLSHPNSMICGR